MVDAELLEDVLNGSIGPATEDRYRVAVERVDVSWRGGNLTVRGIQLRPAEFGTTVPNRTNDPAIRFSADVETVSFQGVRLWRLLRHGDLEAREFTITAPSVAILVIERPPVPITRPAEGTPEEAEAETPLSDARADSTDSVLDAVARRLPYIHVQNIAIDEVDATIVTLRRGGEGQGEAPLRERVRGLSLAFDDFRMDPNTPSDDRFLWSEDVRMAIESMELGGGDRSRIDVGAVELSSADGTIDVAGFTLTPPHSQQEFLAGMGSGGDRVELETGPIAVKGLQFWRLLERLETVAEEVRVDGVSIHILSDKHRSGSSSPGPPAMPHDVMRELPVGLTVERVEIQGGSVTYAERGPESDRPGSVTFSEIQATALNVSNEPARVASHGPTTLEAQTRLFDAAPVRVRASIPLLSPAPTMFFFAEVGSFDASAVNAILPDLEGIRVTDGHVDSARVDIRYGPQGASGVVMVGYEDLSIRQEDRNTGGQSLGQRFTSFVANTFVIRGSNRPDGDDGPREGTVDHRQASTDPFFKIFWEAIREGLIDVAQR